MLDDFNSATHERVDSAELLTTETVQRYLETAKPCARLVAGTSGRLSSRLGGLPVLGDQPWPKRRGRYLSLLAVVDLADLAGVDVGIPMPESGVLNFFYDADRQPWGTPETGGQGGCVVHVDGAANQTAAPPGVTVFDESPVEAIPQPSYVHPLDQGVFDVVVSPEDLCGLEDLESRMRGAESIRRPLHQVGGWPFLLQHSLPGVSTWGDGVVLLQLDSDQRAGWAWGDSGLLYFVADRNALAASDFSGVRVYLQCC